jgi:hypothetical protein
MRTHGARQQRDAVKRAPREQMQFVFEVFFFVSDLCRFDEYCIEYLLKYFYL